MKFLSTRNSNLKISGREAIVKGISEDGGLFVPEFFPSFDIMENLDLSYTDLAHKILSLYLTDFDKEDLLKIIEKSYGSFEDEIVNISYHKDFYLELYHGRTSAFKDFALCLLPNLLAYAKKSLGIKDKTLILTATSGDTGKAALEGFYNTEDIDILVLYPTEGVSSIQKAQMDTTGSLNSKVISIDGNFDDAQSAVKKIFNDVAIKEELKKENIYLSSANSINIGRLLPQIVYYFYSYADLVKNKKISGGEKISFCVPTGNFGDILAGYYAKEMGLPVDKLVIASNDNNVLTDFFTTGTYDANRDLVKTISPSMDILVSSNLERLIFHKSTDDLVKEKMDNLRDKGLFDFEGDFKEFLCGYANEEETRKTIKNGSIKTIDDVIPSLKKSFTKYSSQGYRVLGLSYKFLDDSCELEKEAAQDMIFKGFLLFIDPLKEDIRDVVNQMNKLGVALKMITGDNQEIAKNIGSQIGLNPQKILLGEDLSSYSISQLNKKVLDIDIFAEISPNQKEKIIRAYKEAGEIVGYMGDGINDAPAIKVADVGISVDTAADTAKDAASIVLLQNSLTVLLSGIKEGRRTFINTLKYIFVATSANFGNMFSMAGASLFLKFLPLLPKQILLTNLLTDFPSLQIASDSVDEDWLKNPVKWDMKFIKRFMVVFGIISSLFDYVTFFVLIYIFKAKESYFQTGWMLESVISAMVVMLIVRTARPIFKSKPSKKLILAIVCVSILLVGIIYSPINSYLGLVDLPIKALLAMFLISFVYALVAEALKKEFYKRNSFSRK
ncbi:threonine synthase [Peptoniphilus genitalis]